MMGNEGNHKGCPYLPKDVTYGRPWWTPIKYETKVIMATYQCKDVALPGRQFRDGCRTLEFPATGFPLPDRIEDMFRGNDELAPGICLTPSP